jgi:hypothetical protein
MSIRILDGAPMSRRYPRGRAGTACLFIDTNHGLVLVDTGLDATAGGGAAEVNMVELTS